MSDSPDLIALRSSLADTSEGLPSEAGKQVAQNVIRQILNAIENGVCPLGDWERRCLGAAITSLRGGRSNEARSRARQALWPEENRRNAAIAKFRLSASTTAFESVVNRRQRPSTPARQVQSTLVR